MGRFVRFLCAIGARREFEYAAPTQVVEEVGQDGGGKGATGAINNVSTYTFKAKAKLLDRWLDKVVEISGSEFVFFVILGGLLAWAFLGIPFGQVTDWQVGISDSQAVINLVFDSFLMRQQLNAYDQIMIVSCCLRSRTVSHKRMLKELVKDGKYEKVNLTQFHELDQTEFASELPTENLLGRISTAVSVFLGHIATVTGFWVCIFIWIGFGQHCGWSSRWLLYINSATSALMVFMLAFLANIRERHKNYAAKCLELIYEADAALELRLRAATGDTTANQAFQIPAPKVKRIQRWINFYADLVGTLLGIAFLLLVMIIWVVIGPALSFDSNWWLLIGTYAGLIGMNDGFVLRNIFNKIREHEDEQFDYQMFDDMDILALIGVTELAEEHATDNSLSCRISVAVGNWCSHELTVLFGGLTILCLIIGSSAMRWSLTGQLLCNVPPSIIESFFTMILLTGHNIGEDKRRVDLHNIYLRRLKLISYVDTLVKLEKPQVSELQPHSISIASERGPDATPMLPAMQPCSPSYTPTGSQDFDGCEG
jgi:low-affinity ferrous iron transport protein